ncbi:glycoside hydrolase family 19 protein [Sphingomonas sp. Leaf242]|uniref:glycoside hydrolase family 19 protein n=1 Tax=Sphingomonas sp. Leaf242 TaxID=1736304 RepID=UPI0007126756|nr:glycoside hydrolase family 19 protein [Sphingomonas sp. Leaf242]KQO06924.1 glycoside hydrolase [Sphingomonas sp. Leaf242]
MFNISKLQTKLGVKSDGDIGPKTLTALFEEFGAKPAIAAELAIGANKAFRDFFILDTGLRLAHFMGQCAHESGGFRYMEEIASGAAYEGRKDLGNTQRGDGKRFKGRGPIQLTGRANYTAYGKALGLDFISDPTMVAKPEIGIMVAARYWMVRGLNAYADADDIRSITKRINGGFNGLDDRVALTNKAKALIVG